MDAQALSLFIMSLISAPAAALLLKKGFCQLSVKSAEDLFIRSRLSGQQCILITLKWFSLFSARRLSEVYTKFVYVKKSGDFKAPA